MTTQTKGDRSDGHRGPDGGCQARVSKSTVSGLKDGMTRATVGFADTQEKVKEGMEKAMKTAEELMAFSQGNLEAMVKSGQIWAAGMQDLGKQIAATAQASFEETMSTFKALTSVKSLKDAFDLQATLGTHDAGEDAGRVGQADRRLDEADRADAGAAHRPGHPGDGEVRQGRLIAGRMPADRFAPDLIRTAGRPRPRG